MYHPDCLCVLPASSAVQYLYVSEGKSWAEAQSYCRDKYTDLATIYTSDDIQHATEAIGSGQVRVWIGLYKNWGWSSSSGQDSLIYKNWDSNEPDSSNATKVCTAMKTNGKWISNDCNQIQPFICYSVTLLDPAGAKIIAQCKLSP
uniref:C-type lectin domain-containing protein n=1 Tax=Pygocentrus nattereri TaxID=42514 RepID=A0A3B4CPG4_PYGNA